MLFDLDDTLLDHRGAAREALSAWGGAAGSELSLDDLDLEWRRLETLYYAMYQRGELTKLEQRRARVRALLMPRAVADDEADGLFATYWACYRAACRMFPDADRAIERALNAGLRVGILTNGEARDQEAKIRATRLHDFRLPIFASSDLPSAKPDPRAFRAACHGLGVEPDRCLMVGDSIVNDVDGALAAGLDLRDYGLG